MLPELAQFIQVNYILLLQIRVNHNHIMASEKKECMGCQTSFQQGQKLIMENLITEYKNYALPLKDDKAKWTILKTIISFLNCKGGTIYIGVEDNEGAVIGLTLERKERDTFKLYMKQLIEKIYPKVDLNNRQEVIIQFVPVFKEQKFEGKYVVKMIVQQGDPSQTYCLGEKIKLEGNNNKVEEFEVFYAYLRHNMGGTEEYKGVKLLQLIQNKAKNPIQVATSFHENCNPEPPHLEVSIRKICFNNIGNESQRVLQEMFQAELQKLKIENTIQFVKDKRMIQITVEDEDEFKETKDFIVNNLVFLNEMLEDIKFEIKGDLNNYFLIQNINNLEKDRSTSKPKSKEKMERKVQEKKQVRFPYQMSRQPIKKAEPRILKEESPRKVEEAIRFSTKCSLSFTHIEPSTISGLENFLRCSICKNIDKSFTRYKNTLEMCFKNQLDLDKFREVLLQRERQLIGFGFHQQIRYGQNQGILRICNYDRDLKEDLKLFIIDLIGPELKSINFLKEDKRFSLACTLVSNAAACEWLDLLLKNKDIKNFKISGSYKNSNIAKMKIYLDVK